MFVDTPKKKPTIFCWALISPNKKGSFEDYLWKMGKYARDLNWRYIICVTMPVSPELQQWLREGGSEVLCIDKCKASHSSYIIGLLKEYKVDILHTHFLGPADPIILKCKFFWGGKIVFTDHASSALCKARKSNWLLNRLRQFKRYLVDKSINLYLPVSNYVARRIAKNTPSATQKIKRLYNGIDLKRFSPFDDESQRRAVRQRILGIDDDKVVVCFIGQLTVEKGIHLCLNLIETAVKKQSNCQFVIVGNGNCRSEVEQFCAQQNYREFVRFLGLRSDVDEIMKCADIMLSPSVWGEAFGLSSAEASASGIPVIASDVGGLNEVVRDRYNGLIVPAGDEEAWAESLDTLVTNPQLRGQFRINGRKHAEEHFDISHMVKATFEHYQTLLEQK